MTFTGARICNSRVELTVLLNKLDEEGYLWASGDYLSETFMGNTPVLLVFDARKKRVYFTSRQIEDTLRNLDIDPKLI